MRRSVPDFRVPPGASPITGAKGGAGWRPPTDAYAFYLPWHEFPLRLWGIYLIVQGIKALGTDIHLLSRNWLSRAEANPTEGSRLFGNRFASIERRGTSGRPVMREER